jgi:RNase adaptor protein for sRNA GlmZ degradation
MASTLRDAEKNTDQKSSYTIYQFSFKYSEHKVPRGVKVVDCRTMKNCFNVKKATKAPQFEGLVMKGLKLLQKNRVVAFGCEQGKHRSVAVAEEVASRMQMKAFTKL